MALEQALMLAILAVPLAAAAFVAASGPRDTGAARALSLFAVVTVLALTAILVVPVAGQLAARPASSALTFQPIHTLEYDLLPLAAASAESPAPAVRFAIGLDGFNIWLVALTSLLMVPAVLVSWTAVTERANEFYAWLLVLQAGMTGVFLAFDLILFYVFFELTLVPLFFLIGIWGGPMRRDAARKFFLYTLTGSLITLLGMLGMVIVLADQTNELTLSIPRLIELMQQQLSVGSKREYWLGVQAAVFLALTCGFAVKVPLVPVHTWLPLAHVEAPTAGSVLLAGVLLKLGTYGFLRLAIPLCPDAALQIGVPLLTTLAAVGVVYGALCALAQPDIKKLVAYSSVSHMGVCVLGLFALNAAGIAGALMQMINHGLSTGMLFLLVGMLYERYHTRMIPDYGGIAAKLKLLSVFMVFACLSSVGMPGLNGFVGEMLILAGVYNLQAPWPSGFTLALVVAVGIVLGGVYLFTMLMKVFFGPLREPGHDDCDHHSEVSDLNARELAALVPLAVVMVGLGVWPQPVLNAAKVEIDTVAKMCDLARGRAN